MIYNILAGYSLTYWPIYILNYAEQTIERLRPLLQISLYQG